MTNERLSSEAEIAVYLGLGSNIGDRLANLREAIARIEKLGLEVVRESSIYETEPVGFTEQPWFLNQVVEMKLIDELTSEGGPVMADPVQAQALLSELLNIERTMGRERTDADGPRVIDIDLLLFGNKIIVHSKKEDQWSSINRTDIVVPHPRMHERRFVLEPLCEIAPELFHPVLRKTCRELLADLDDDSKVGIYMQNGQGS
jgi:2-amino-4-hydroxy-6-hydroxymethyldihydropteridine diphosphokinase